MSSLGPCQMIDFKISIPSIRLHIRLLLPDSIEARSQEVFRKVSPAFHAYKKTQKSPTIFGIRAN